MTVDEAIEVVRNTINLIKSGGALSDEDDANDLGQAYALLAQLESGNQAAIDDALAFLKTKN